MRVHVVARHCDIPDAIQKRTEELVQRLTKYEARVSAAEVVYEEVKHLKTVDVVLSIDRGEPVVARAEGGEFRTALDKVIDRLARILRRQHSRATKRQGPRISEGTVGS